MLKTIKIERQNVAYKYLNICYMVVCKKSLSTFAPIHYLMAVKLFLFRARVSDIFACKHKYTQVFESLLYSYTDSWNPIYSPNLLLTDTGIYRYTQILNAARLLPDTRLFHLAIEKKSPPMLKTHHSHSSH